MSPSYFRGRPSVTSYLYDDDGRIARTITASQWGPEDRALMLAFRIYRDSLCPGCRQPREKAWHPDMDGWYEVELVTCQACTAVDSEGVEGEHKPKTFPLIVDTRDYSTRPLPPLRAPDRGD